MDGHPPLANAELAIMDQLWDHGEQTARALREALYPEPSKAQHGTIQRLLQRLGEKGYVVRHRLEHAFAFRPTLSRKEYAGTQLESLAEKLTGGSLAPMLTHLLETKKLSGPEIARLRSLLEEDQNTEEPSE